MDRSRSEARFTAAAKRAGTLQKVRPNILVAPMLRLLSERMIIEREGLRLFVDPTSNLGLMINRYGTYEELTVAIFRNYLRPGDIVLDIGANEGFFAALASSIVGPEGRVIAVEPQTRLHDILEINLALNPGAPCQVIRGVVGEEDGSEAQLHLYPSSNTGASSLVRQPRLGSRTETVRSWTPERIAQTCGLDRFDFIKVDVEGFEPEVARSLIPLLDRGAVRTILMDYHSSILAARGINPDEPHQAIVSRGYRLVEGDPRSEYVVYQRS
jgi:FkbM family methyltransferase